VFKTRRFLLSARWEPEHYDAYVKFFKRGLRHPGLVAPLDVFRVDRVLFSVVPYAGEGLMLDEASPLTNERVFVLAQRCLGAIAYLHTQGVALRSLTGANCLVSPDNTIRLFDLDVVSVHEDAVPDGARAGVLQTAGEMFRRYCDIDSSVLVKLMSSVEAGEVSSISELGRTLEGHYDAWADTRYPALDSGMTDVGLSRQLNEDNWGWVRLCDRAKLYVVADGMGGHDGGEVASALAVQSICRYACDGHDVEKVDEDTLETLLDVSFQAANNTVKDHAEANGIDMGTTLVSILIVDHSVGFLANVGDSRGYLLRDGTLHQVSKDHSLVQKMVERGRITAEEARTHPHSNILLRTVGTERDIDIDIFRVELESGDKVMMCSDGLWGEVEDRDMETILNTYSDPRIAARELVRAAHHGGGKDNVTLVIVGVP
jgi:protein phosphatase